LSEEEMVRIVQERHVDEGDAQAIAHYIYHNKGQNRLPTSAICEVFSKDAILDVVIIRNDLPVTPPVSLVSKCGTHDLVTSRVMIAGRKKSSAYEPDILSKMTTKPMENLSDTPKMMTGPAENLSYTTPKLQRVRYRRLIE